MRGRSIYVAAAAALVVAVIGLSAAAAQSPEAAGSDTPSSGTGGVIAIGHSGLTGENSDPAGPGSVAPENSWATGTNAEVESIYQRLMALVPETEGRVSNQAQGGAPAQTLAAQAEVALREVPTPALAIIQTIDGDIRCDGTDDAHVAEFGQAVQTALDVITSTSPETRILMVSQLGRPATEAMVLSGDATLQASLRGTGICDFYDPGGEYMPDRVAALTAIIEGYEAEQSRVCAEVPQCHDDGGVLAADPRDERYVSSDWGHLNIEGQGHVAELIWPIVSALLELPM